jgi:methylated-DNA-protein-cysteine methyltransferase-like protein
MTSAGHGSYQRIYRVVARIPRGRVATYGQVADLAGLPGHARQVGYALHSLPDDVEVPWHRVINARGEVSDRFHSEWAVIQRSMLESEGIRFDPAGNLDLTRYRWKPTPATVKALRSKG